MGSDPRRLLAITIIGAIMLIVLAHGLGRLPFLETTEARYAEISREMAVSGDWVTPRLNGIKHFDKPPMTYWITAAAFQGLGASEISGRLPLLAAALLMLWYTWRLGRLLFPEEPHTATAGVFILFSSMLFLVMARFLSSDLYLACFVLAAAYHLFRWHDHGRHTHDAVMSALFIGLGILTKGHVVLVFLLLPWLSVIILKPIKRPAKWGDILILTVLPVLMFLPWALTVLRSNPQLLSFFVMDQTYGRVFTDMHHRSQPFYFHAIVLFLGMSFWFTYFLTFLPRGVRRSGGRGEFLLLLFTLIPFIFFSLIRSKLPPYLLPAVPFYAVLIAHWLRQPASRSAMTWAGSINFILAGALVAGEMALPWLWKDFPRENRTIWMAWAIASLVVFSAMLWTWNRRPVVMRIGFGGLNVLLFMAVLGMGPAMQDQLQGFKTMAAAIEGHRRDARPYRIIAYEERLPSIAFYTGVRVIQIPHDRNLRFEDQVSLKNLQDYLSQNTADIPKLLAQPIPTYLVIKKREWSALASQYHNMMPPTHLVYATPKYIALGNQP